MKKEQYSSSNQGFTLVEIIVAIAVASIVSLVALQIFSFGNTTLNKSEDRSFNQMSVRNASIAITDRVRYAKELEFLNPADLPSGPTDTSIAGDGYDYIYFDENKKTLIILHEETPGSSKKEKKYLDSKLNAHIKKSYFYLEEDPSASEPEREVEQLTFKITGKGDRYKEDDDDYSLKSTVNLLNSKREDNTNKGEAHKYRGIKYKK